jgi:hypothetical protein
MFSSLLLSISTTIAIRYSCVRRQTANPLDDGFASYFSYFLFLMFYFRIYIIKGGSSRR